MTDSPLSLTLDAGARGQEPSSAWRVWCVLWLTMLVYSAVAAPVPGVNEPHYLGKAKHFWNPAWCPGDLLYESSNAHWVFYFVMGYWANWLSLPQLAWVGRGVGYGLLAVGWLRTHRVLGLTGWQSWWSLLGFLALASWGNLSGEWMVGGIEGKIFSYGFLLLAFAEWQANRLYRAALWAGLAISFHPIAGGWGVLAAMLVQGMNGLRNRQRPGASVVMAGAVLIVAALPGVIPALSLILTRDPPDVRINGTYLQVYYRLAHHLDPMKFSWRCWAGYGVLAAMLVWLRKSLAASRSGRIWMFLLLWSAMFALVGLAAGWGARPDKGLPKYLQSLPLYHLRTFLLKFYPFRLFDVLVPMTVAIQGTVLMSRWLSRRSWRESRVSTALCYTMTFCLLLALIAGGEWRRHQFSKPTVFDTPEWTDVCHWIREHTPTDALIQTPVRNQQFKWLAERAEYVAYKDMPQDNVSLVEWNRRMNYLNRWYKDHHADGVYSNDELRQLRAETGVSHILTDHLGPFELPACYTNDRFRVYDLTELDQ